jgi:hypothetical protein
MKILVILLLLVLSGCGTDHKPGECYKHRLGKAYAHIIGLEDTENGKMVSYRFADIDDTNIGVNSRIEESWDGEGFKFNYPDKVNCNLFDIENLMNPLNKKVLELNDNVFSLQMRVYDLETKKGKK